MSLQISSSVFSSVENSLKIQERRLELEAQQILYTRCLRMDKVSNGASSVHLVTFCHGEERPSFLTCYAMLMSLLTQRPAMPLKFPKEEIGSRPTELVDPNL